MSDDDNNEDWIARHGLNRPPVEPVRYSDAVDHPSHYTQGAIECIDAIQAQLSEDQFEGFLRGQVAKYMWRLDHKGQKLIDVQKALWYTRRLIALYSGG